MSETFLNRRVTLHSGDSRDVLKSVEITEGQLRNIARDAVAMALGGRGGEG